ncbi:hypothetical protein [Nocardioides sp.]|uniref:hypothetical protein n=1 Tax=Nocardioides sp. TaxID=35761 RepID=UPI0035149CA4
MSTPEPAPGDLQRVVDDVEQALHADPALAADVRAVLRQLGAQPFDVVGDPNA